MSNLAYKPNLQPTTAPFPDKGTAPDARQIGDKPAQSHIVGDTSLPAKRRADGATGVELISVPDFLNAAGVSPHQTSHHGQMRRRLHERLMKQTVQSRSRNAQRKATQRISLNQDDEDDYPIRDAASKTISSLRVSGKKSLQEQLESEYDPLQNYALLHNALCELEEQELPLSEKEDLKEDLTSMLNDLMKKHRDEIRKGLKDAQELETAVNAMARGPDFSAVSLRELRFMYGAKGPGYMDSPLSPQAMAKALQQKFGSANFSSALTSLQGRMSSEFRTNPQKSLTPRLWLCMSDASAFNAVRSTFAIAGDLRRDLIEKAHVLPRTSPASMTISMLSIVEGGKSKVNSFIFQLYDHKSADANTKGRVYTELLQSFKKLPTTLWPQERTGRMELMEELRKQVLESYRGMPMVETSVERHEREWRAALSAKPVTAS
ncbi:hypothetical protein EGT07_13315 [Herbaspirillum sp. HC18]|nr:hypothetical protein EGT07_13315 [Herbaspirillum sp. HC18]